MAAHAGAGHRDFCDIGGAVEPCIADPGLGAGDGVAGADIIGGRHREGEVGGGAVLRNVLHDHVDVDIGLRQRAEDRGGDAPLVLDLADGNLAFVLGKGHAGDPPAFPPFLPPPHPPPPPPPPPPAPPPPPPTPPPPPP